MVRRVHLFYRFLPAFLLLMPAFAQERPLRPVHTFSIVAFDPATGEMGVAVQSHPVGLGGGISRAGARGGGWGAPAFIDPSPRPPGPYLMRAGKSAPGAPRRPFV